MPQENNNKSFTRNLTQGITMLIVGVVMLITMMMNVTEVNAQTSIEVITAPGLGGRLMIGKDDPNSSSFWGPPLHCITFSKGITTTSTSNEGMWWMGSFINGFNIGRVWNMQVTTNPYIANGGQYAFFIGANGVVGINKYTPQPYTNGTVLDVAGKVCAEGSAFLSDRRYKRDIKPINNLDNLFKVNAVQYKSSGEGLKEQLEIFKKEHKKNMDEEKFNSMVSDFERRIAMKNEDTTTSFGFIAQELKEIFPNLVSEDEQGFMAVDYIGLIPVMLDAIKELNSKMEKFEGKNRETTTNLNASVLYQNNPNPFDKSTEIKYYVPNDANNVSICVYDLTGLQLLKVDITTKGYSSIHLNANQFRAGMYLYSLLVDGLEVDTKKMVITE